MDVMNLHSKQLFGKEVELVVDHLIFYMRGRETLLH